MFLFVAKLRIALLLLPWPLGALNVLPRLANSPVDSAGGVWKQTEQASPSLPGSQPSEHPHCPSLFAAVFTRRDDLERRALVRQMWKDAGDYGLVSRFAVCGPEEAEDVSLQGRLLEESSTFHDLMFLDCEEGYLNGILTRKVLASMHAYLMHYSHLQLFMKIDDDTFISPRRLCTLMDFRRQNNRSLENVYMGVFAELAAGEQMKFGNKVMRDPSSPWYEPVEDYPAERYPVSAKGGPGYILSKRPVKQIAERGIGRNNVLNVEDKSVGVWVEQLQKEGEYLEFVNLKGTDGYEEHKAFIPTTGKWRDYPFTLHHHLKGETISCLHQLDMAGQPDRLIDACFEGEE